MAKGGKRVGAGRKVGSVTKPRLADYLSEKEIIEIIKVAKEKALAGDPVIIKLLLEQHLGKPHQALGFEDPNGDPITVNLVQYGNNPSV